MIWAESLNGVIGKGKDIPWAGQLPADMRYFQLVTMGNPVLMGRKTYESLPPALTPLKGRANAIISRNADYNPRSYSQREDYDPEEVFLFGSLEGSLRYFENEGFRGELVEEIFVIGGGELYAQAIELPEFTTIYRTVVEAEFDGDVKAPTIDPALWEVVKSWHHEPYQDLFRKPNLLPFRWEVYQRRAA